MFGRKCKLLAAGGLSFAAALSMAIPAGATLNSGDATESLTGGGYGVLGAGTIAFPATTLDGSDQTLAQTGTGFIDFKDASGSGLGWNITAQVSTPFSNTPRSVTDAVTANASTSLTSATALFVAGDVGRTITGGSVALGATIASVTNGTTAVMSANATGVGTNLTFAFTLPNATIKLSNRTALTCDGGSTCTASGVDPGNVTYPVTVPQTPAVAAKIYNVPVSFGTGREGAANNQNWALGGTIVAGTARAVAYTATITYTMAVGI